MTVEYEPCPVCEGMGYLLECPPRFVDGELGDGGTYLRFSICPERASRVQCHRCEGLKRVPKTYREPK